MKVMQTKEKIYLIILLVAHLFSKYAVFKIRQFEDAQFSIFRNGACCTSRVSHRVFEYLLDFSPLFCTEFNSSFILQLSNIITMPLSGILCESSLGWRSIYYLYGGVAFLVTTAFFAFFRDSAQVHR